MDEWRSLYEEYVISGRIKEAKELVSANVNDEYVYKYCSGTKQQLDTLMSKKFWLSSARLFNDPFDSLSLINVRTKAKYNRYNAEDIKLAIEEYNMQVESDKIGYEYQQSVFVTCFSEISVENLHMWSYYSDEHKGFCAKYSVKKLLEAGINILPVVYTPKINNNINVEEEKNSERIALIKSSDWSQEREWRIVEIDRDGTEKSGRFCSRNAPLPEAIYVGCRDILHIDDNWNLVKKLEKTFLDSALVKDYVWRSQGRKISLNEILDSCEKMKEKRIPLYSMAPNQGTQELIAKKVKY